jgi:hypothetical protein
MGRVQRGLADSLGGSSTTTIKVGGWGNGGGGAYSKSVQHTNVLCSIHDDEACISRGRSGSGSLGHGGVTAMNKARELEGQLLFLAAVFLGHFVANSLWI